MELIGVILLAIAVYALYLIFSDQNNHFSKLKRFQNRKLYPEQQNTTNPDTAELKKAYYVTSLLTKPEATFYSILKSKCDLNGFTICPKVRLEDFIHVRDIQEKQSYRGRIKSRHVDFLICDRYLNPLCGIELDDNSHNSMKAQKTDTFKNELYNAINLKLYRVQTGTNFEAKIDFIVNELQPKSTP